MPLPLPSVRVVSRKLLVGTNSNRAVTVLAVSITTLHGPLPVQAPDHPTNRDPAAGAAVSATRVPVGWSGPGGCAATVPLPSPSVLVVNR